jgi:hypothetical protein
MGDFFKPWQRKIGVVTLMMACALMAGWIRSLTHFEGVSLPVGQMPNHFFVSWDSSLVWLTENAGITGAYPQFKSRRINAGIDDRIFESPYYEWRWKWCGFGFGVATGSALTVIPYWSVAIPMTLVSVWLLLISNFRQSNQKKRDEPAINEEGSAS